MFCGAVRQIAAMLNHVRTSMTVYGAMMPVTAKRRAWHSMDFVAQ
jgi:hypothetical protein